MRQLALIFGLTFAAACSDKEDADEGVVTESDADADADADADGDADEGPEVEPCTAMVTELDPEADEDDWFYRDALSVEFDLRPEATVEFGLSDASGTALPFEVSWDEDTYTTAFIAAELTGNATYTLSANCANEVEATFTTSPFGAPLESGVGSLVGNVYELDLPNATIAEPPGIGSLLGLFLQAPLLASVQEASDESLTLLVAQGIWDDDGVPYQDMYTGTYPLPPADFLAAPYFSADTDLIEINYQSGSTDVDIPMHQMHIEGTFSPDGTSLGGAWIDGLVDTRNLGTLLSLISSDSDDAVCNYLEGSFSVPCEDCGNGDMFCLYLKAFFDDAPLIEGLAIEPDPLGTGG